jgi:5-methylcytosine-specific restriction endonuclease McrA
MTTRPIGNGTLFETDARSRFMTETKERYRLMELRAKRRPELGPLPFTLELFRAHVLGAMGGKFDGVLICKYCRRPFTFAEVAADHAVPLDRGGGNDLGNIEFPCQPCNDQKSSMLPDEFEKLLAFIEKELPFARVNLLKRLQVATKLQAGWAHNLGVIGELKKSGSWQKAGKAMRARRKAKTGPSDNF